MFLGVGISKWGTLSTYNPSQSVYTLHEDNNAKDLSHPTGYPRHRENREIDPKNSLSGKTQEIWKFGQNTGKTQEILFAQVVNSLILKVKDIAIFAMKVSILSRSLIGLPSQFCVCNSHKLCKLAQGEIALGQRKNRKNTGNLKIQFEWVP